jgi:hypothetical protein
MTTTATPIKTGPQSLNSPNAAPVFVVYSIVKKLDKAGIGAQAPCGARYVTTQNLVA